MAGPLAGYRIIEIAGIGPGPFAAMMLADMGAEVDPGRAVRRRSAARRPTTPAYDVSLRGRRNIAIDLKHPDGVETLLGLVERADALDRGLPAGRHGTARRRPDECLARNPKLVFGRMTGWGQDGPYAAGRRARHQLHLARRRARPLRSRTASRRRRRSTWSATSAAAACSSPSAWCAPCSRRSAAAQGQVVDAAMVDGSAVLMTMFWAFKAMGVFDETRAGHQPARHRRALLRRVPSAATASTSRSVRSSRSSTPSCCGSPGWRTIREFAQQMDKHRWPHLKERLAEVFETKTRDEWCALMEDTDVCFAPVLTMSEAAEHPHNVAARHVHRRRRRRRSRRPLPASRARTAEIGRPPAHPGQHTREVLADWGFDAGDDRRSCSRPGAVQADADDGHARLLPRPSRRRGDRHRRHRWRAASAEGHRVVLVVATHGEYGEVPDDLAPGETLVDRRRAETAVGRGARHPPRRLARVRGLRA